jgi:type IV fimbrial biogenesis protein FimT
VLKPLFRTRASGFTLVELMVTITLLAILMAAAMPAFSTWVRNGKLRAASEALQSGIRLAQAEALRRNRQVVLTLTDDKVTADNFSSQDAIADGKFWSLGTVAAFAGDNAEFIESGILTDVAADVQITGPAALCFNAMGRVVGNQSPGLGDVACELPSGTPAVQAYDIGFASPVSGEDRRFRVTVALGGQVRLCDRDKSLTTDPDGCP